MKLYGVINLFSYNILYSTNNHIFKLVFLKVNWFVSQIITIVSAVLTGGLLKTKLNLYDNCFVSLFNFTFYFKFWKKNIYK